MKIVRIVHLHFDNNSGFWYGDQNAPEKVSRRARTVECSEWWVERTKILKRWTLPSLKNAGCYGFRPLFFFRKEDAARSADARRAVIDAGYTALFDGIEGLLQWLRSEHPKADCLHAVRLDTDDMVDRAGWHIYANIPFEAGLVAQFERGYAYGYDDGRLAEYDARGAPPTFFSTMYPFNALLNIQAFQAYRDKYGMNVPHYALKKQARKWIALPPFHFVQGIHGAGTSGSWSNSHTITKCVRWIDDQKKIRSILSGFGVEPL